MEESFLLHTSFTAREFKCDRIDFIIGFGTWQIVGRFRSQVTSVVDILVPGHLGRYFLGQH